MTLREPLLLHSNRQALELMTLSVNLNYQNTRVLSTPVRPSLLSTSEERKISELCVCADEFKYWKQHFAQFNYSLYKTCIQMYV